MVQFDAYSNPNVAQRDTFPHLVVMQSNQLAHFTTRLVMPLVKLPTPPTDAPRRLAQPVLVNGERLYPAAHLCGAVPARLLRQPVCSLASQADVLRDAMDDMVSGV